MVDVVQEATEVDGAVSVRVSGGGMEGGIEVGEGTPYLEFTVRLYGEAISDLIAVVDVQPSRTEPAPDLDGLQAAVLSMIVSQGLESANIGNGRRPVPMLASLGSELINV